MLAVARKTHFGHVLDVPAVLGGHRFFGEAWVVVNLDGTTRVARDEKILIARSVHGRGLKC